MRLAKCCAVGPVLLIAGCPLVQPGGTVALFFDFDAGTQNWEADVSDYGEEQEDIIDFEARIDQLPDELDTNNRGYFVTSSNRSDDLFAFLKRQVGPLQGLTPETAYTIQYTITIASKAPSGCFGIGGAPGEAVYLKAGGSSTEPEPLAPDENDFIGLSVDKGNQSTGGPAATVIGNIANGQLCDDPENAPYVSITRIGNHAEPVTTDAPGNLWLLVGTDSGYEGVTTIYFERITVVLTPVEDVE